MSLTILRPLIYVLPAYIANCTPVFVGGGPPLDFGRNFIDGKRIFGDNKTIRGLIGGIFLGTLIGFILPLLFPLVHLPTLTFSDALLLALLLSLGTHAGDLFGSFIKRRLNMKPGAPAPILDQLGFLIFALAFALPFFPYLTLMEIIVVVVITLIIHPLSNLIAYILKLKDKPW